jgi:Domain of unknown function (DUF4338)/DDE_Tnp_1-associated
MLDKPLFPRYKVGMQIDLKQICVRPASENEEPRYRELMAQHHYLGDLAKIGHTLWYVATYGQEWVALLSFSASALKCAPRDQWIGWDFRHQYGRLKLIANNSRFLILPDWHRPNLASKVLALCQRRIGTDWLARFDQPLLLLETFVDTARYRGTVYRAGNWTCVGQTQGHRRIRDGYSERDGTPKLVFVRALRHDAQSQLSRPLIQATYRQESPRIMLSAAHMSALPRYFKDIPDTRRAQGRRHPLPVVLAICAAATLCGMDGYKAIAGWAKDLGVKARERFGCRIANRLRLVPSESTIRDVLIGVDPDALDRALQRWNADYGQQDQSLAIDGKTMCNAIDEEGRQTHIMSVVGHDSAQCYTQKKSAPCP